VPKQQDPQAWLEGIRQEAEQAWATDVPFHIAKFDLGGSLRPGFFGSTRVEGSDVASGLWWIESVGWRLFDCGYVFMPVKERAFSGMQDSNVIGLIVGIYTFRRPSVTQP